MRFIFGFILFFIMSESFSLNISTLNNFNLVNLEAEKLDVIYDIKYSTDQNFVGKKVYKNYIPLLHKVAAENLKKAIILAKVLGYKIKFFDGFRPLEVQEHFFHFLNDERYVTNPKTGIASHCRGIAIDLTLVDAKTGQELEMGTEFDDMTEKSHHNNHSVSKEAQKNRIILAGIMHISGFEKFDSEWWHYQLPNYTAYPKLSQIDLGLDIYNK